MSAKSQISIAVVLILISISIFIIFSDSQSHIQLPSFYLPSSCAATWQPSSSPRPPPLKVFMYDLPRRFNFDMMGNASGKGIPMWPEWSGLKRQHSVEYWFMVSLLAGNNDSRRGSDNGMEAVRVLDGDEADVYFVPFFSSLSFNTHGRYMTDPETEGDRQLQVELLDILRKSKYWQRSLGRDHVIPMQHPNAFRFLRDQVNASIFLVADFGRYPRNLSSLSKDVVTPYVHVVNTVTDNNYPEPFEFRRTLLFFRGRTVRKDEGKIRVQLAKILKGHNDVRFEDSFANGEGIRSSALGMRTSKFCLHPAGDTPSSCRLFDAIVSHCVPVIISDHIELPFESELDYSEFSLFFSTHEALRPDYLVSKLRNVTKDEWVAKWTKLKGVSHHFEFQYPPKKGDAVNMLWRQVRGKVPDVKLAVHRNRRLKIPDWW